MAHKPSYCHFSCDHCGTAIMHHCIIVDAEGSKFCVGTDCVVKTTHTEIITKVKLALKKKAKADRAAKRQAALDARNAAYEAEMEAQRDVNGGLTDREQKQEDARSALIIRRTRAAEIAAVILDALQDQGGDFCYSIAQGYRDGVAPRNRAETIVIEIIAKQSGRKGSKAYTQALPAAEKLVTTIREQLTGLHN